MAYVAHKHWAVMDVARRCWNGVVWLDGAESFERCEITDLSYGGVAVDVVSDMLEGHAD
jgi:hypothetical protein